MSTPENSVIQFNHQQFKKCTDAEVRAQMEQLADGEYRKIVFLYERRRFSLDRSRHGVEHILGGLANTSIEEIDFGPCSFIFTYKLTANQFFDALAGLRNSAVRKLSLPYFFDCTPGSELKSVASFTLYRPTPDYRRLWRALKGSQVSEVDLSICGIGRDRISSLFHGIEQTAVTHLDLSQNRLGKKSMNTLLKLFAELRGSHIQYLNLEYNKLHHKSIDELRAFGKLLFKELNIEQVDLLGEHLNLFSQEQLDAFYDYRDKRNRHTLFQHRRRHSLTEVDVEEELAELNRRAIGLN